MSPTLHTPTPTRTEISSGRGLVTTAMWGTRAMRAVGSGARAIIRACAEAVHPAGALVIAAATVGLAVGIIFGWIEWMVAGAAALLLVVMSLPFLFAARASTVTLSLDRGRLVAGGDLRGHVTVTNTGSRLTLPGAVDIPVGDGVIELAVPLLRAGHHTDHPLELTGMRRGILTVGPATAIRSDPLGLFHREHSFDDVHLVHVHPQTVALPSTSAGLIRDLEGSPTRELVDADISFHAIREYAAGDSWRNVHWKSTAKTGQLMVRQFEQTRRSRMAIVVAAATSEYRDADEFELAVRCGASLGLRAVRDAREVDVVMGSEIPRVVRGRVRAIQRVPASGARALLDGFSGVAMHPTTMAIDDVCRLTAQSSDRLSIAFIVLGSAVSAAQLRQAAVAFSADTTVVAVVCDELAHPRIQVLSGMPVLTVGVVDDLAGHLVGGLKR